MSIHSFRLGNQSIRYDLRSNTQGGGTLIPMPDGTERLVTIAPGPLALDNVPIEYHDILRALHASLGFSSP